MTEFMLDTSAVGEIEEGFVSSRKLYTSDCDFYITHIQEDELSNAGDHSKFLFRVLDVVDADKVPTSSLITGVSRVGQARVGGGYVKKIQRELSSNDRNDLLDAIIADTAIQDSYLLVTHDYDLRRVVNQETPGEAISMSEFKSRI